MKYNLRKTLFIGLALLTIMPGKADDGQGLFTKLCSPCHTIGKGRIVGPDLKNVTERRTKDWITAFIHSSQSVIKSGDADAVAIFKEYNNMLMPDQPLDAGQIQAVIQYIEDTGSGATGIETVAPATDLLKNATPEDVETGLLLFTGNKRLSNKGVSCISCHKVKDDRAFSSGTLAKELTETYGTIGSAGVSAILKSPPFPAMGASYKDHALTDEEILSLTAYLKSVSDNRFYQQTFDFSLIFAFAGFGVFLLVVITTMVLYFDRKKKSVNDDIFNRQNAVIN